MSAARAMLVESAARLFGDLATRDAAQLAEQGGFSRDAWRALEDAGFTHATLSEARGGDGADLGDVVALLRESGRHALGAPLAETLLAELALAAAGLAPRSGVLTIGPVLEAQQVKLARKGKGWSVSGTLHRLPWARHADAVVMLALSGAQWTTLVVDAAKPATQDRNLANEPRDSLALRSHALAASAVGKPGKGWSAEDLRFMGALFRSAQMAGALSRVLELSVQYAKERVQFGRPIGQFQAVQQQLAVLAAQSASANAALDAALEATGRGPAHFEIATAKARIGEAAHLGCSVAHAVHAAMGFTQEHPLHRYTRRLWSWRDEFGSDLDWAEWVGEAVLDAGGEGLWVLLTDGKAAKPARRMRR
jgi:acyl-CoA dehydrogenase